MTVKGTQMPSDDILTPSMVPLRGCFENPCSCLQRYVYKNKLC